MTNAVYNLNIILAVISITLCLMGLVNVFIFWKINRRRTRQICITCILMAFYAVDNLAALLLRGSPGSTVRIILYCVNTAEFLLPALLIWHVAVCLLEEIGSTKRYHAQKNGFAVLVLIHFVLLMLNLRYHWYFCLNQNNVYQRGSSYIIAFIPSMLIFLEVLYQLFKNRRMLTKSKFSALCAFCAMPVAVMPIQTMYYGLNLTVICTVITGIILNAVITSELVQDYVRQEKNNADMKVSLLLSQMQPHFLYNSLLVIQQLCVVDSEKAYKAVGEFTDYLRHNIDMNSLTSPHLIPFEEEIGHVRNYVRLYEYRFGNDIKVVYDFEITDFMIPPLVLQPIVENAIRHGIRKTSYGKGTVTIRTAKKDGSVQIEVEDDGVGMEIDSATGQALRESVGISNARQRINAYGHGTLTYRKAENSGTVACIVLPYAKRRS